MLNCVVFWSRDGREREYSYERLAREKGKVEKQDVRRRTLVP
jgi:hypothetical protein